MKKEILKRAIDTYGPENQLLQATEECAEFIQAVSKYRRAKTGAQILEAQLHLAEEIADCIIMMEQAKYIVGESLVEHWMQRKLDRLDTRLKEEAQNG